MEKKEDVLELGVGIPPVGATHASPLPVIFKRPKKIVKGNQDKEPMGIPFEQNGGCPSRGPAQPAALKIAPEKRDVFLEE